MIDFDFIEEREKSDALLENLDLNVPADSPPDVKKSPIPTEEQTKLPASIQSLNLNLVPPEEAPQRGIAFLRYALGVGVAGPLAGLAKYALNPRSLLASAVVMPTLWLVAPTVGLAFTLGAGFIAHAGVALYQTFKKNPLSEHIAEHSKAKGPKEASALIQHQTLYRPIAQAVIFGFRAANRVAGRGTNNEPYGEKAYDLCLKLENPKIKLK